MENNMKGINLALKPYLLILKHSKALVRWRKRAWTCCADSWAEFTDIPALCRRRGGRHFRRRRLEQQWPLRQSPPPTSTLCEPNFRPSFGRGLWRRSWWPSTRPSTATEQTWRLSLAPYLPHHKVSWMGYIAGARRIARTTAAAVNDRRFLVRSFAIVPPRCAWTTRNIGMRTSMA